MTLGPITIGFLMGFICACIINALPISDRSKYVEAIRKCEEFLPRNQTCTVIGVVKQ